MDFHCDAVRMSAMALRDGEPSSLSGAQIQAHLAGCAPCRQELEGLGKAMAWFEGCVRRDSAEDLWPEIARQLDVSARKERSNFRGGAGPAVGAVAGQTRIVFQRPRTKRVVSMDAFTM